MELGTVAAWRVDRMLEPRSPALWQVTLLVRSLDAAVDPVTGQCAVPAYVSHCHGVEVQHADGIAECRSLDEVCPAPGPGRHVQVQTCDPEFSDLYTHTCAHCYYRGPSLPWGGDAAAPL